MNKNKGITLIALVVTIIVLLILAGVAIAMLSGENGILKKAAEAKTKTEEGQKEEETTLSDMEITTDFLTNNVKYKIRNGYMTGFTTGKSVEDVEQDLKKMGYEINSRYNPQTKKDEEITDKGKPIATGMKVEKNKKELARVVIFGDIDCDGRVSIGDITGITDEYVGNNIDTKEFQLLAMDVNEDKKINALDTNIVLDFVGSKVKISQDKYAQNPKEIEVELTSVLEEEYRKEFIKEIEKTNYTIEKDSDGKYWLKGVESGTTVQKLKEKFTKFNIIVKRNVILNQYSEISDDKVLQNDDQINIVYQTDGRHLEICYINL